MRYDTERVSLYSMQLLRASQARPPWLEAASRWLSFDAALRTLPKSSNRISAYRVGVICRDRWKHDHRDTTAAEKM
jgi:hypothetical protein